MRRFMMTAMVIGAGALGFAAVSQAGMDRSTTRATETSNQRLASEAPNAVSGCRIEKSWKYDYHGKPYMKKVRVCA